MKLRLYHYWRSSSSWRVRWAFALKGVSCELASIDLLTDAVTAPEHLRRNPMGFVPVVEFLDEPESSPNRFLAESLAIVQWIDELVPSPPLLPADPLGRARVRQLAEIINAGTQPLQNPNVAEFYSGNKEAQVTWNQHWILHGLGAYETLAREVSGKFSYGDSVTLADLCLIPQCHNALRYHVDLSKFPVIKRISDTAQETESCRASAPDRYKPV